MSIFDFVMLIGSMAMFTSILGRKLQERLQRIEDELKNIRGNL